MCFYFFGIFWVFSVRFWVFFCADCSGVLSGFFWLGFCVIVAGFFLVFLGIFWIAVVKELAEMVRGRGRSLCEMV